MSEAKIVGSPRRRGSVTTASMRAAATRGRVPTATIESGRLNRAVSRAARLTNSNYHTESMQVFSRLFGYDDLTREYDSIMREHNRAGYLTPELSERRNRAYDDMIQRIRTQYGEEVLRRVRSGL